MKKTYEMLMVIDPKIDEEKRDKSIELVKKIFTDAEGDIEEEDIWGMRKFAYEIKKRQEGYYMNFTFNILPETIADIRDKLKLTKEILRFIILKKE